jgi:Tol biopolymer transport system component
VLFGIPPEGGVARQLTDWSLEATRPALSPDGETIAVCGHRGGGFHLWSLRSDGSGLHQLTDGPWDDRSVAWSPDGRTRVFSSERGGSPVHGSAYGMWTMDLATGHLTQVTGGAFDDIDPTWWPDGSSLVCVRAALRPDGGGDGGGGDGGLALIRVPLAGGDVSVPHSVAQGRLLAPSVSPSGRGACLHLSGTGNSPALPAARTTLMVDGQVVSGDEDLAAAPGDGRRRPPTPRLDAARANDPVVPPSSPPGRSRTGPHARYAPGLIRHEPRTHLIDRRLYLFSVRPCSTT